MTRALRKKGRGTLHILMALLLASAVIRLGSEAGPAIAQAAEQLEPELRSSATPALSEDSFLAALQEREVQLTSTKSCPD